MQTQTTFVRSNCVIKLYTVTCVYLYLTIVINPCHTELELSVRLCNTL